MVALSGVGALALVLVQQLRVASGGAARDPIGLRVWAAIYFVLSFALWLGLVVAQPESPLVAYGGAGALGALGVVAGFFANRWSACSLAVVVWFAALTTDLLWAAGVIDRSAEHEPYPLAYTILFWEWWFLPAFVALIALGVAVRRGIWATRRGDGSPTSAGRS